MSVPTQRTVFDRTSPPSCLSGCNVCTVTATQVQVFALRDIHSQPRAAAVSAQTLHPDRHEWEYLHTGEQNTSAGKVTTLLVNEARDFCAPSIVCLLSTYITHASISVYLCFFHSLSTIYLYNSCLYTLLFYLVNDNLLPSQLSRSSSVPCS